MLDKAAKIEALINGLSNCRIKLMEAKATTEKDAIALMDQLQTALVQEEDMTVIGAEAFEFDGEMDDARDDLSASFSLSKLNDSSDEVDELEPSTQNSSINTQTNDTVSHQRHLEVNTSNDQSVSFLDFFLCRNISSYITRSRDTDEQRDDLRTSNALAHVAAVRSQDQLARAAQEWRRRNGKDASQFRTGRSGDQGVLSHNAHEHGHLNVGTLPRVSDHCGLTPRKRVKKKSTESTSSLSFVSFG